MEPRARTPGARNPGITDPGIGPRPPRLAVVIPTLNEARALPALLARLTDPAAPAADRADEVVVADGGSGDGTCELARRGGARLIDAPRGRGSQLAAGARASRAELLLFLHADCQPAPGALEALRRAFADPRLVATAMHQEIAARGLFYRLVERAANARARRGVVLGDSGLMVRAEAYRAVGGFRPLPLFEDLDLGRRLRGLGPLRLVPGARLSISPRRWEREGALRCTLRNWMLRMAYAAGVAPRRLQRLYPPHASPAPPGLADSPGPPGSADRP